MFTTVITAPISPTRTRGKRTVLNVHGNRYTDAHGFVVLMPAE